MEYILGTPKNRCQGTPKSNGVRLAYMDTWNKRLTVARKDAGKSKTELARAVGVSNATVSDWESGEIKKIESENLLKACEFLNVSPNWLQFGKGEMGDVLYVHDDRLKHALKIMQELPEYAVDDAIKELDQMSQLIKKATTAAKK